MNRTSKRLTAEQKAMMAQYDIVSFNKATPSLLVEKLRTAGARVMSSGQIWKNDRISEIKGEAIYELVSIIKKDGKFTAVKSYLGSTSDLQERRYGHSKFMYAFLNYAIIDVRKPDEEHEAFAKCGTKTRLRNKYEEFVRCSDLDAYPLNGMLTTVEDLRGKPFFLENVKQGERK